MPTVIGNNYTVTYPSFGFVFNRIVLQLTSNLYTGCTVEYNGIIANYQFYNNELVIDVAGIFRSAFVGSDLSRCESTDYPTYRTQQGFSVTMFYRSNGSSVSTTVSPAIFLLWGALQYGTGLYDFTPDQPDSGFYLYEKLYYFEGFPFTISMTFLHAMTLQIYSDGEIQQENITIPYRVNRNIDQYSFENLMIFRGVNQNGLFEDASVFDRTFDYTFKEKQNKYAYFVKEIFRHEVIPSKPIYLRWRDQMGEWKYFMFKELSRDNNKTNSDYILSNENITVDYEEGHNNGSGRSINSTGAEVITVGFMFVDINVYRLIASLFHSVYVDMFMGYDYDNVEQWLSVTVVSGNLPREANELENSTLQIKMPDRQGQTL